MRINFGAETTPDPTRYELKQPLELRQINHPKKDGFAYMLVSSTPLKVEGKSRRVALPVLLPTSEELSRMTSQVNFVA